MPVGSQNVLLISQKVNFKKIFEMLIIIQLESLLFHICFITKLFSKVRGIDPDDIFNEARHEQVKCDYKNVPQFLKKYNMFCLLSN